MRWLKWAILTPVALEIFYVMASAIFLNGPFLKRLINTDPEELLIDWQSAFSPLPGLVFVQGITGRVQDDTIQIYWELPSASVGVFLPSLFKREFHTTHIRGGNLSFRLRLRRDAKEIRPTLYETLPPIPGLPSLEKDRVPSQPGSSEPWHIRLAGISIDPAREIWIEEYRFAGAADIEGGFHLVPGRLAEIYPSSVETDGGVIYLGGNRVADNIETEIKGTFHEFFSRDVEGMKIFNYIEGSVRGNARIDNMRFLNYYLRRAPWLRLDGGAGRLTVAMETKRGELTTESHLELASRNIEAHLWNQRARGEGIASWSVRKGTGKGKEPPHGVLKVELGQFEITHATNEDARITGKNLVLEADSPDLKITDAFRRLGVRIEIPEAKVSNLRYFNSYLPASSGLKIRGGSGTLRGLIEATSTGKKDHGELVFHGTDAQVGFEQLSIEGDVKLTARLDHGDMQSRSFVLTGTTLDLRDLVAKRKNEPIHEGKWWGRADIDDGVLQVSPTYLSGKLRLEGKNARPLIAIFTAAKGLPGIVEDMLSFEGLWATARLRITDDTLKVQRIRAKGKGASLKGFLDQRPDSKDGGLLLAVGPLAAGIEVTPQGTEVKLNDAYGWYENLEKSRRRD